MPRQRAIEERYCSRVRARCRRGFGALPSGAWIGGTAVTGLLVAPQWLDIFEADLFSAARDAGLTIEPIVLPHDPNERLDDATCAQIDLGVGTLGHRSATLSAYLRAPKLQWIHIRSAGFDNPAYADLMARGVSITNSSGANAIPIAQSAITGMLVFARDFRTHLEHQKQRRWETLETPWPAELQDQTLLVFGLGAIGTPLARIAKAIGMHVIGVRRSGPRSDDPVDELYTPAEVDSLLPRADWLAIASPLNAETRGFFSAERLALLPPGAHVINVGRGRIVDEAALTDALRSGRLGGAYLDVFETEPLPAESPLWDLPNVIVSPHSSAKAPGNDRRSAEIFFENLGHWSRGEPLRNEVRPE